MPAHRFIHIAVGIVAVCCLARTAPLHAQDSTLPDIENSKYSFAGVVNSNAVYVRSGPSENDYPTAKLDKGAEVRVVGLRFDWLKVVPPEGSFCYVAKAYVDRRGNGTVGRVTSTLYVRVGSQLNELKAKIATKLEPGADVEIIGEEQEYFKIKPPQGVHFYVNKQFVEPVRPINVAGAEQQEDAAQPPVVTSTPETTRQIPSVEEPSPPGIADSSPTRAVTETTPPAPRETVAQAENASPSTQPSAEAEAEFERLEGEYAQASLKPLDEQPVSELLSAYQKLADSDRLPESLRRISDFKAEVLKSRLEIQQQFADTRKNQDQMKQKQLALNAEQKELEQRIKETDIQFYTAVGTLRPSSLQIGSEMLYRLTDPANGRTVVYIRSNESKIAAMIGEFIGVKGQVSDDSQMNLRVIALTSFEPVNPSKVGQTIAAQIVPSSLLPSGSTARTE